jgi:hypothetical protein
MQLGSWIQRWIGQRSAAHAWGLSPGQAGWLLVGLGRDASRFLGVHRLQYLTGELDDPGPAGVSQGLRQCGMSRGVLRSGHLVHVGMAMDQVASGALVIPVGLAPSEREAEVQLEAARMLNLEPEHISFDWHASPLSDGVLVQLHWVACPNKAIDELKRCVRRSGAQLASVEPVMHAARRAAACLSGGLSTVLTRPVQDWQFDPALAADHAEAAADIALASVFDHALDEAMQTPVGPGLVATGLALKAWA